MARIERSTKVYNDRRYGKPWIARVDFTDSESKPKFVFGQWVGDPGADGLLIIDLEPGDIYARGQKDHRGKNEPPSYYQLGDNLKGLSLDGKLDALKAWRAEQTRRIAPVIVRDYPDPSEEVSNA